jgi:cytoskeletal protein CcmA (bactofilin family)
MAVGRISGPLLKDNLLRNGVDLAFETSLLYLDVGNSRVGVNTASPAYDLDVNGTTRTTNLYIDTSATLADITVTGNTISSTSNTITFSPSGINPTVYQGTISVGNLNISGNTIQATGTTTDINITAAGSGQIKLNNSVYVTGDLHATGSITADGNITLGNASTDTVTFDAEINSDIIPKLNNHYNLGSSLLKWANLYTTNISVSTINATDFTSTGNLTINGTSNLSGNNTIGSSSANTLSVLARISSNLIPNNTSRNLGTDSLYWNTAYINTVNTSGLQITSNSITSTGAGSSLYLSANGSGTIYIPTSDLSVTANARIGGTLNVYNTTTLAGVGVTGTITQTGNFNQTGNFTTSGNLTVTGDLTVTGSFTFPNITISGSTITTNTGNLDLKLTANGYGNVQIQNLAVNDNVLSSVNADANILLTPQGTGNVVINNNQSLIIPVGTTGQQPNSATNGMVRYNTTNNRYEGYSNGYWTNLGGVSSVDGKTYITTEASPGTGDNVIRFYANNVNTAYIDSSKLYAVDFQTSKLDINTNTISAIATDTDINFITTGTGGVKLGNLRFTGNTVTNTAANAVTRFNETGTGYVQISGTNGVVIPVGNNSNYPLLGFTETGMIRFNTDEQYVEVYTGTEWNTVSGTAAGVTTVSATDIALGIVLSLG